MEAHARLELENEQLREQLAECQGITDRTDVNNSVRARHAVMHVHQRSIVCIRASCIPVGAPPCHSYPEEMGMLRDCKSNTWDVLGRVS